MTRRLPVMLVILGIVIILASFIASAITRSSDTATLALPDRPDSALVVTEPGVLDAVDPAVTIRATADSAEPVVLAIGRTADVEAWIGQTAHERVVGLSSWEELNVEESTSAATAPPEDASSAPTTEPAEPASATPSKDATPSEEETALELLDPAGSDLWVAESDGTGTVELSWTDEPGRWSLVAATNGAGPAPMVELEWGRQASTPWLIPGIILGALALLAGAALLVLDQLARREQQRRDEATASAVDDSEPDGFGGIATIPANLHDTDPGTGERLSRRQIREMEREVARAERRRPQAEDDAPQIPEVCGDSEPAPEQTDAGIIPMIASTPDESAAVEPSGKAPDEPAPGTSADEESLLAAPVAGPEVTAAASEEGTAQPVDTAEQRPGLRGRWARRRSASRAAPSADEPSADESTDDASVPDQPTGDESGPDESSAGPIGDEPPIDDTGGSGAPDADNGALVPGDEPVPSESGSPAEPESQPGPTAPPSWRSVWGFGRRPAAPQGDQPTTTDDDEGGEAR